MAFMARVRYTSVNALSDRGMSIHFGLPAPLHHARIRRVERIGNWFVHHVRITTPEQLDEELLGWLRESYQQTGLERLQSRGSPQRSGRPNLT